MKAIRMTTAKVATTLVIVLGGATTTLAVGASAVHQAKPAVHASAPKATKTIKTTYNFNASYSGTISILWNSSKPSTGSITGKGSGTNYGLTAVTGSGSAMATAQSDPINGAGVLSGAGNTLHVQFATGSTATATGSSAPTTVIISGSAKVTSGTGKFAKATGTLKVSGTFSIKDTSGKEADSFVATLKGAVVVVTTVKTK